MGERIRNIGQLHIGDSTFIVELNDGYSAGSPRCIHIQNDTFRYQLDVPDFCCLADSVIKAQEEMKKSKEAALQYLEHEDDNNRHEHEPSTTKKHFCSLLGEHGIRYRYIETFLNCTTLMINREDYQAYNAIKKTLHGIQTLKHPQGSFFGYTFLYKMHEFELLRFKQELYEIYFELPCMSLSSKTWIPLDRLIQETIWKDDAIQTDGIVEINEFCRYIYKLSWTVFKRKQLTGNDISYFNNHTNVLEIPQFKECLEKVFFSFSKTVLFLLRQADYGKIIPSFYSNVDY